MSLRPFSAVMLGLSIVGSVLSACSGDSASVDDGGVFDSGTARGPEATGQECTSVAQCYSGLDASTLQGGAAVCLDRVTGGYCTHLCKTDADCCAVPGECKSGFRQVCAPFESTGQMMCFLSCEQADLKPAPDGGVLDSDGYCHTYASAQLGCRSTGGGSKNRKVCLP